MNKQPEALRMAECLNGHEYCTFVQMDEAAAELRRLHQYEKALNEFLDKTKFIQDTAHFSELGMHRADVIRKRFEQADAREKYLSEKLEAAYEEIDEQARLLGMSAERELSLRADVDYLMKVIATYHSKYPEIAKTLYSAFSDYGQRVGSY